VDPLRLATTERFASGRSDLADPHHPHSHSADYRRSQHLRRWHGRYTSAGAPSPLAGFGVSRPAADWHSASSSPLTQPACPVCRISERRQRTQAHMTADARNGAGYSVFEDDALVSVGCPAETSLPHSPWRRRDVAGADANPMPLCIRSLRATLQRQSHMDIGHRHRRIRNLRMPPPDRSPTAPQASVASAFRASRSDNRQRQDRRTTRLSPAILDG
jgi:hypothetical protein